MNPIIYQKVEKKLETELFNWLEKRMDNVVRNTGSQYHTLPKLGETKLLELIFDDIKTLQISWSNILSPYNLDLEMEAFFVHSQPQIEYFNKNTKQYKVIEFGDLLFVYTYDQKNKMNFLKNSVLYQAKLLIKDVTSKQLDQYIDWFEFDFKSKSYRGTKYDLKKAYPMLPIPHTGARYLFLDETYPKLSHNFLDSVKTATPDNNLKSKSKSKRFAAFDGDLIEEIMGLFLGEKGISHITYPIWDDCISKVQDYCYNTINNPRKKITARGMTYTLNDYIRDEKSWNSERIDSNIFIIVNIDITDNNVPKP